MINDPRAREDARLVNEIRFGDIESFKILYEKYHRLVLYLCDQRGLDKKESDDVLHEVFIRIWSAVHTFDESKAPFIAWFVCFTRNIMVNRLNKDEKYVKNRQKYYQQISVLGENPIKGTKVTFNMLQEHLTEMEAEVVGYRIVFGSTFKHISECTRLSVPNARNIYHKAIEKLRDKGIIELNEETEDTESV